MGFETMNTKEIVSDSLRYPFRDWKKILFLGIIILFSNIANINAIKAVLNSMNVVVIMYFLMILGYIIGFFGRGYMFRIMKSSLTDVIELPKFNNWIEMFIEGIKVTIVCFVYAVPAILIMLIFIVLHFNFTLGILGTNPSIFNSNITFNANIILGSGIWGLIAILYSIIIIPIIAIAIAHMANNSKLSAAFKFKEILNKISIITWSKLIKWYLTTGLIMFILALITVLILFSISYTLKMLLICLALAPYLSMYVYRSAALIYNSEEK
jgi:hypothetical protein